MKSTRVCIGVLAYCVFDAIDVAAFSSIAPTSILRCPSASQRSSDFIRSSTVVTVRHSALTGEDYSDESVKRPSYFRRKWSDFLYGADYVHSRYLALFWEYNFRRTMPWLLPFAIVLAGSQVVAPDIGFLVFGFLKYLFMAIFVAASALGSLLQLPFDVLRGLVALMPAIVIPLLDRLPSKLSIALVKFLLELHSALNVLLQSTFLTGITVMLWRPMIEEIQYRYLLNYILSGGRRRRPSNVNGDSDDGSQSKVEFIPLNDTITNQKFKTETTSNTDSDSGGAKPTVSPSTPASKILLLSSIAFAITRLGWLCAQPEDTVSLPFLFLQAATSPYSWTVAFMQSAMAHFSSHVLSELSPFLERSLMLLAIQQALSTFFVTWYVFVPLYQERGIAASIGGHMTWTFGKMTWPIRLLFRVIPKFWVDIDLEGPKRAFLERKR